MHRGWSLLRTMGMETDILALLFPRHFWKLKETMRYMTMNYLQLYELSRNGDTTFKVRWSLYLSEFDIKLIHTPGHKMIQSDTLSRRPDFIPDEDTDNENVMMLPDNLFIQLLNVDLQ